MSAHYCPDCLRPRGRRRPRQDARCDYCRTQVGQSARLHQRFIPDADELAARFNERTTP